MKRIIITLIALICFSYLGHCQSDSLKVSTAFTTHVIFPTELTYADLSNKEVVAAKIIEQNKNILAVKAKCIFEDMTSISALESNGKMHTYGLLLIASPEVYLDTAHAHLLHPLHLLLASDGV